MECLVRDLLCLFAYLFLLHHLLEPLREGSLEAGGRRSRGLVWLDFVSAVQCSFLGGRGVQRLVLEATYGVGTVIWVRLKLEGAAGRVGGTWSSFLINLYSRHLLWYGYR